MNNRKLAIQELFEGLSNKFGANPNSKKLILSEIRRYIQNKPRITVDDIEEIEERLKKIFGKAKISTENRKKSSSSIDNYTALETNTIDEQKTYSIRPQIHNPNPQYMFPYKKPVRRLVEHKEDHIIFPAEHSSYELVFEQQALENSSNRSKSGEFDDWGKIVRADHLKFLKVKKT